MNAEERAEMMRKREQDRIDREVTKFREEIDEWDGKIPGPEDFFGQEGV